MLIGTLGSPARARVGSGGELTRGDGISVEWWIGADDRWHLPGREITARQSLLNSAPIVRTALRVPGGDAIATTYAVHQGRSVLAATLLENRSRLPFAVAVVVRGASSIALDGTVLRAGGVPLIVFDRPPQLSCSVARGEDLLAALRQRTAERPEPGCVGSHADLDIAFLLPAAHTAALRWATVIAGDAAAGVPVLSALPDAEAVARGWDVQASRATSIAVGDQTFVDRYDAALRALLLRADAEALRSVPDALEEPQLLADRVLTAYTLARAGMQAEPRRLLSGIGGMQGLRGELGALPLTAIGAAAISMSDDAALAAVLAGALEHVAKRAKKSAIDRPWAAALALGAIAFDRWGERAAARAAWRTWRDLGLPWPLPPWPLPPLPAASLGAALVPEDTARLARTILDAVDAIATWHPDGEGGVRIDVLAGIDDRWRGQAIEARRVAAAAGALSFAARWHERNLAILWEAEGVVTLSSEQIDPAWRASGQRGEALLVDRTHH